MNDTACAGHLISLGAGVQSTTMALMAAAGELQPMPAAAIFADTGWEPRAVYDNLAWLESRLPFPIWRVSAGNIRDDLRRAVVDKARFASIPYFTDRGGMGRRLCTNEYKLTPIRQRVREFLESERGAAWRRFHVVQWIGISRDEASRMKPSDRRYMINRFPLVDADIRRHQCLLWMTDRHPGWEPVKSACIGCPYHSDATWRDMQRDQPDEFADAVAADRMLRVHGPRRDLRVTEFMHRSLRPLDQIDFRTAEERGQLNLFENECEGLCGV